MRRLEFRLESNGSVEVATVGVSELVIAGWAGRDRAAMEHHIAELEALGVARPKRTPTFYRVSAARLTTDARIDVSGAESSGEVEPVLISAGGELYVGVGSDHTDRKVETYGITVSKQMCDKPVSETLWRFADVAPHWDSLILRSYATIDGRRVLYQEGSVAGLLPPGDLIGRYIARGPLPEGTTMFGGTIPAIGGIRAAARFEGELHDPVLGRTVKVCYDVRALAIAEA